MQLLPSRGSTISQCTYSHCKSPPRCTTSTRTAACAASQGAAAPPATISAQLSVYAVSDLHCDYSSNLQWVCSLPVRKQQSSTTHANDQQQLQRPAANDQQQLQVSCCIVPGDISDDLRIIRWVRRGFVDSCGALLALTDQHSKQGPPHQLRLQPD